jgi:hypothetical protein
MKTNIEAAELKTVRSPQKQPVKHKQQAPAPNSMANAFAKALKK